MSEKVMCQVTVWRGWGIDNACGKPAKGKLRGGMDACGVHLNAERKREEYERERQAERERENAKIAELRRLVDALAVVGVTAWVGRGGVVIGSQEAHRLIQRLGQ